MAQFRTVVIAGLTLLLVGGSTLLYCDTPGSALSAESRPPISRVARLITIPVSLSSASEVRAACLPIGAGLLWLFLALAGISPLIQPADQRPPALPERRKFALLPRNGLFALTIATLAIAILAAMSNDAWALSKGWCFQFAAGAAWAIGLAALIRLDPGSRTPTAVFAVMTAVAIAACILTFWHRSTLGIQYVRWPIGPLTITGCMAGVWAAMAVGMITGSMIPTPRGARLISAIIVAVIVLALSAFLASAAGRRSSYIGVAAALTICAAILACAKLPARRAATGAVVALIVFTALLGTWLSGQFRSTVREVSGPITIRQAYYRAAAQLIAANPLLGIGPDMTVCRVTTDLARERAEHPHVIHGGTVPALHSEWLQAALELGVPGGLVYLAIPLSVIMMGIWAIVRKQRVSRGLNDLMSAALLLTAIAGLTAVIAIETTSINLRGAVMPATYWTLVGLATGLTQQLRMSDKVTGAAASPSPRKSDLISRVACAGVAGIVLLATFSDLQQAVAHARGNALRATDPSAAAQVLDLASDRYGAANWMAVRVDRGLIESDVARMLRNKAAATTLPADSGEAPSMPAVASLAGEWTTAAVNTWADLVRRCPGYPGAGGFLGEALLGAGRAQDARSVFEGYLSEMNPYDPAATLMYAMSFVDQPLEKINLIRRGLRAGAVEPIGRRVFLLALKETGVADAWPAQVEKATADLDMRTPESWQDPLAPETLRMEAVRLLSIGELAAACAMQDKAANAYKRLFEENHAARRAAPAEIDAWKIAADVRFESDPRAYRAAFERVLVAEKFAVLSVEHEYRRNPPPDAEFVGGVVTPVETPDVLATLWRLSAKLHIAVGRTANESLTPRLLHAMTTTQRESLSAQGALFAAADNLRLRLTAELVTAFNRIEPERRPANYNGWVAELMAAGVTTQPAATQPITSSEPRP